MSPPAADGAAEAERVVIALRALVGQLASTSEALGALVASVAPRVEQAIAETPGGDGGPEAVEGAGVPAAGSSTPPPEVPVALLPYLRLEAAAA